MNDVSHLAFALFTAFATALMAGPLLTGHKAPLIASLCCLVACCPLLVPAKLVIVRAATAFACTELVFKIVDYARQHHDQPFSLARYREYAVFILPFPPLAVVFGSIGRDDERRRAAVLVPIAIGLLGATAGLAGRHLAGRVPLLRDNFALDHLVTVILFVLTIESLAMAVYGLERLVGYAGPTPMRQIILSRSVAEFWWRYNARVQEWFRLNVFLPVGGQYAPARGIWLVFLASALLHEWMFAIATSRMDGYQFAFFILQAPAILASRPLERAARQGGIGTKTFAHALTIAWFAITSIFFFHGVNRIFPVVYASEPWLP